MLSFRYLKNNDGNVAIMFSICLLLILIVIGVAVDMTALDRNKSKLRHLI